MMRAGSIAALVVLAGFGCEHGVPAPLGLDEPVRTRSAQFIEGDLPSPGGGPSVTLASTENAIVLPGQGGKAFAGRAQSSASAIALRLADIGTGYWVFPLGAPDPQYPGELNWSATCDFAQRIGASPGLRTLLFAAIDGQGRAGSPAALPVCFASSIPDNLHGCDPTRPLPEAVLSLRWDSDVDLDLVVIAPDGQEISAKTAPRTGTAPRVDRDSLAACATDGRRAEHAVFSTRPHGTFTVYTSLFDACGLAAVSFTLDVYEATGEGASRTLVATEQRSGRMIALDANGGRDRGLFVTQHVF